MAAASSSGSVTVAVTGANGFLASHIVKQLLAAGYSVRGTVRDPADTSKICQLLELPGAAERLQLHKADLLDGPATFEPVFKDCAAVFHTASPFFTIAKATELGEEFFSKPAIDGTTNVLTACQNVGTKHVVLTSSTAAVMGPRSSGHVYSETDWNDPTVLRERKLWYILSKTLAEQAAWDFVKAQGDACSFKLSTMQPCMIAGPMLQKGMNSSSEVVLNYLTGAKAKIDGGGMAWVDVRDVAKAHILAFEKGSTGRHVLVSKWLTYKDFADMLRGLYPSAKVPTEMAADIGPTFSFDTSKSKELGIEPYVGMEELIRSNVDSLIAHGHLHL